MSGFPIETGNPANPGEMLVDVNAARVALNDRLGNSLSVVDATNPTVQQGIPAMGLDWKTARAIRVLPGGGVSTGQVIVFQDPVDGAAVNTNKWVQTTTTHTITQSAGMILMNAASSVAINTGALHASLPKFAVPQRGRVAWRRHVSLDAHQTGHVYETGLGLPTTAIVATTSDGAFIRKDNSGQWRGVVAAGGSDFTVALITDTDLIVILGVATQYFTCEVEIAPDSANFRMLTFDGVVIVEKSVPMRGDGLFTSLQASKLPVFDREWNSTALGAAVRVRLGSSSVSLVDQGLAVTPGMLAMLQGHAAYQSPVTSFGFVGNYVKDTAATARTLVGTAAGEALFGGLIVATAMAGAQTDLVMFGFLNNTNYTLLVDNVTIPPPINQVVAVATTATVFQYALGFNNTAVSLATAGTRYVPLAGFHTAAIALPVGGVFSGQNVTFSHPEGYPIMPGRFFHVICRCPIGTATATETFLWNVLVTGKYV